MPRMRVRLTFPTELIQQPIVYHLVRDFAIVPNIRRADVRADHGWMVLELACPKEPLSSYFDLAMLRTRKLFGD